MKQQLTIDCAASTANLNTHLMEAGFDTVKWQFE
jgi:hypothetical protein